MVRISTMLHRTPAKIHRNSQNCRAKITMATMEADSQGAYVFVKSIVIDPTTTRTNHRVLAKLYVDKKTGKPPKDPKCWVHCSCGYFKFFSETALCLVGSSSIINSNGALPKITNSTAKPSTCKHCLAFFRVVKTAPMKIETKMKSTKRKDVRAVAKLQTYMDKNRSGKMSLAQKRANADLLDETKIKNL
jgi:hypothetical protein